MVLASYLLSSKSVVFLFIRIFLYTLSIKSDHHDKHDEHHDEKHGHKKHDDHEHGHDGHGNGSKDEHHDDHHVNHDHHVSTFSFELIFFLRVLFFLLWSNLSLSKTNAEDGVLTLIFF